MAAGDSGYIAAVAVHLFADNHAGEPADPSVAGVLLCLVGTLLFALAVWSLVRAGHRDQAYRPVVWALVASLVVKGVSGPDLADTSGILWMSLGVLAHAAARSRTSAVAEEDGGGRESADDHADPPRRRP